MCARDFGFLPRHLLYVSLYHIATGGRMFTKRFSFSCPPSGSVCFPFPPRIKPLRKSLRISFTIVLLACRIHNRHQFPTQTTWFSKRTRMHDRSSAFGRWASTTVPTAAAAFFIDTLWIHKIYVPFVPGTSSLVLSVPFVHSIGLPTYLYMPSLGCLALPSFPSPTAP